jgi:hypothetical protein
MATLLTLADFKFDMGRTSIQTESKTERIEAGLRYINGFYAHIAQECMEHLYKTHGKSEVQQVKFRFDNQ